MQTFLFYDIETSGLNKCFDQVIEFAAIRTDLDFNEIERHHFYVKLSKDTVPSPGAFITHRIGLDKLEQGLFEHDAINKIHTIFNKPGTISLGYNTLGFDDEFLRFSFAKCLLPPYTHQYQNNCARMDLYPLTVLYFLYNKDVLQWPYQSGKVSFKLENIAKKNDWLQGQAHHAMTDVIATLSLAKALAAKTDMWQFCHGFFNKYQDWQRTQNYCHTVLSETIPHGYQAILVDGKFGAANNFAVAVLCLGNNKHYNNQVMWLRLDNEDFINIATSTTDFMRLIIKKKLAEPALVLPWKEKYSSILPTRSHEVVAKNLTFLEKNPDILIAMQQQAQQFKYAAISGVDIDASLYLNGFLSDQELALQKSILADLASKADSEKIVTLKNTNQREQLARYIWRFYSTALTATMQADYIEKYWQDLCADGCNIMDFRGKLKLNPATAKRQIKELQQQSLEPQQQQLLQQLSDYIRQHFNFEKENVN